jgi:hypothetical protein
MAVNVNTVYQTVLALANKEQRGYITPQEFNMFAKQAQMQIFEQYFYDLNQFKRIPGNNTEFSNMTDLIEQKLNRIFLRTHESTGGASIPIPSEPDSIFYRLSDVTVEYKPVYNRPAKTHKVEIVPKEKADLIASSGPLIKPSLSRPIGYVYQNHVYIMPYKSIDTTFSPGTYSKVYINYYRQPAPPRWTYITAGTKAIFNASAGDLQHFELHASEEYDLILKILQMAGISIKEFALTQASGQAEVNIISQQKQ